MTGTTHLLSVWKPSHEVSSSSAYEGIAVSINRGAECDGQL